jgi:hypothetical protein
MNTEDVRFFYRNIIREGNHYSIRKGNKVVNTFVSLENALAERDLLEKYDWDYESLIMTEYELENKYLNMELPEFPKLRSQGAYKGIKHKTRNNYVYYISNAKRYQIRKTRDGVAKSFGNYVSKELANKVSDELQLKNWPDDWEYIREYVVRRELMNKNTMLDDFNKGVV